jgi:hypothetical protein
MRVRLDREELGNDQGVVGRMLTSSPSGFIHNETLLVVALRIRNSLPAYENV